MSEIFQRTKLVAGAPMMERLQRSRVLLIGLGGVGSWAGEALVRSGIGHITLVDSDIVAASNINRQLPATTATVGQPKVDVLAKRFLEINPELSIELRHEFYSAENADSFDLDSFDFVLDAIDSLACKAELILRATASRARLFSSMGAARKLHASLITTGEFRQVHGDPLARALMQHFRRTNRFPSRKFRCVYAPELLPNRGASDSGGPNGTFAHTTAIFGLTLAGLVIESLYPEGIEHR